LLSKEEFHWKKFLKDKKMAAKKIKITQIRSSIGRPENQKRTLVALGLNKINRSREVEASPQVLGMVRTVAHLLKVEN
jgi:large subunit ribosomal protein L30